MQLLYLKFIATTLTLFLGALATWGLLTLELDGNREYLLYLLSLGCLPLGAFMIIDTLMTEKEA